MRSVTHQMHLVSADLLNVTLKAILLQQYHVCVLVDVQP
jgi:hypothetical protein